jgi:hypothetical protein
MQYTVSPMFGKGSIPPLLLLVLQLLLLLLEVRVHNELRKAQCRPP